MKNFFDELFLATVLRLQIEERDRNERVGTISIFFRKLLLSGIHDSQSVVSRFERLLEAPVKEATLVCRRLRIIIIFCHSFSLRQRFTTSILIVLSGFVVTVALVPLDSFSCTKETFLHFLIKSLFYIVGQNGFFGVTMVIVLFTAGILLFFFSLSRLLKILVGGAVYQSGVFGLAGMFQDHKYTSAVMAGQVWNFLF